MTIYADELDEIWRQQQLAQTARLSQQTASLQTSQNVSTLLRDYPWLPPGVAYSLAQANQTGPAAAQIADLSLNQQLETVPTKFQRNRWKFRGKVYASEGDRNAAAKDYVEGLIGGNPLGVRSKLDTVVRPAVRTTAMAANAGIEGLQGVLRAHQATKQAGVDPETHGLVETAGGGKKAEVGTANPEAFKNLAEKGDQFGPAGGLVAVAEQTQAGQAAKAAIQGKPVDVGSGWLPDPESKTGRKAAQASRDYSSYLYGGHAWTPGRQLAGYYSEPDTTAFTILSGLTDAAVALSPADPTSAVLGVVGDAARARKTFQAVPDAETLVRGIDDAAEVGDLARVTSLMEEAGGGVAGRPFIREKNPIHWLYGPQGSAVVESIAEEPSTYKNWVKLNRKLPIELVDNLSRTTDPAEVRALLAGELGTTLERIPKFRQGIGYNRWLEDVPGMRVSLDNVDGSVRNIEGALKNAKVAPERIEGIVNDFVGAYGKGERYAALETVFDTVKAQVAANGAPNEIADEIGRMFRSQFQEANKYWVSSVTGDNADVVLKVGDDVHAVDGPMLSTERLASDIILPDARTVRRMVSPLRPLYETGLYRGGVGVGDWALSVWKPVVLLRPAWTMRVLGEEQVRLAVSGTGLFRHPISYVSAVMGDSSTDSRIARWIESIGGDPVRQEMIQAYERAGVAPPVELVNSRNLAEKAAEKIRGAGSFDRTMTGEAFTREAGDQGLGDAITQAFSDLTDSKKIYLRDFVVANRTDDHWAEGLVGELRRLGSDADIQRSIRFTPDEFKAWGETEVGLRWRRDLAAGRDDAFKFLDTNKETWDSYVDMVYKRRDDFTRGDRELLDVLASGKVNGDPLTDEFYNASEGMVGWANAVKESGRGPDNLKVQRYITKRVGTHEEDLDFLRRGVDTAFDWLMTKPSNALNRSPDFRIKYWEEAKNIAPHLDASARESLLKNLEAVNLPRAYKQDVRAAILTAPREGTMSLEAADTLARRRALDHVQGLLYDLHKRNQVADALRLVFPFGEAFKEIASTWARLLKEYPQVPRRAQQMYQGAREAQFDPVTGLPTGHDGVGFFRWDPQTQQEVFTYPGSEFLTRELTGVPVPLKGPVRNLNLIGSGLPGVGPAVSIPAAWFLPEKPEYDWLRKIVFPFGKPDDVVSLDPFLPAWAQKVKAVINGPRSDRLYANTIFDVARYLNSTGEYDIQGANAYDEMNRLLRDSKDRGKWLYLVRAGAQASTPSSPAFDFRVEDPSGNLHMMQTLIDKYNAHLEETGDPTETMDWFLTKFGVDNLFLTQAKSTTTGYDNTVGLTSTKEQRKWARSNTRLVEDFPHVWALFAPEGETFDPGAYQAEIDAGQRSALSPDEAARRANDRLATTIYQNALEQIGPKRNEAQNDYLRKLKDDLRKEYPGYGPDYSSRDTPTLIAELEQALENPKLARSEAGQGLSYYLQAREQARTRADSEGYGWPTSAKGAENLRQYLREQGEYAAEEWPAFARMWNQVLSSEVQDG